MQHSDEIQAAIHTIEMSLRKISTGVDRPPDVDMRVAWTDVTTFSSGSHSYLPQITLSVTQSKDVRL